MTVEQPFTATPRTDVPSDITPTGKVISFEDDDDRAYRQFVESHRPEVAP